MFEVGQYELLDFGSGRKLERFGRYVLDRPAATANGIKPSRSKLWEKAAARFEVFVGRVSKSTSQRGQWIMRRQVPATWIIDHGEIKFALKLTDFGHVGVFTEQADNWAWIAEQVTVCKQDFAQEPLRVLNLFAYTGGSTLAAATAGAAVAHVDAARNVVAWARRNAAASGLTSAPIRWIAEDALTFARRELTRGKTYDAIILDPPSYGHGAKGQTWKLDKDLLELLKICRQLTRPRAEFVLLTCHAPDYTPRRMAECLVAAGFAERFKQVQTGELYLGTGSGRRLAAGTFARIGLKE